VAACARSRARVPAALLLLALAAADLCVALRNRALHPAADPTPALAAAACYARVPELAGPFGRHLSFRIPGSFALKDKDGELFGRYSATHYDPLISARHAAYFAAAQAGGTPILRSPWTQRSRFMGFLDRIPRPERFRLFDLLGTGVVLVDGRAAERPPALAELLATLEPAGTCRLAGSGAPASVALYTNPRALPRAFVVSHWSTATDPETALQALLAPGFDARRQAVVEGAAPEPPVAGGGPGEAAIEEYAPTRVVVRARSQGPGLLVLTDAWDADWSARLGGEAVAIHPTDGLFRGVFLPPGESEVVFRYRPRAFYAGAGISGAALLGFALAWRSVARQRALGRSTR
jgi:hypothetical protein